MFSCYPSLLLSLFFYEQIIICNLWNRIWSDVNKCMRVIKNRNHAPSSFGKVIYYCQSNRQSTVRLCAAISHMVGRVCVLVEACGGLHCGDDVSVGGSRHFPNLMMWCTCMICLEFLENSQTYNVNVCTFLWIMELIFCYGDSN